MIKKHGKLSAKIIFIAFLTLFITSIITRILIFIFTGERYSDLVNETNFFIGMILTLALTIFIFTVLINHFLVRRIKAINKATLCVKEGNYDIKLDSTGIDEISTLSENFNLMTEQLRANEYLNKEFSRNFSHEFKTPLSVIRGYAEMVEQPDLTPEERKHYLDIIISETERLSNLTNNMLQISLIDSKAIVKKDDEYNFAEQIRNVIQMTQLKWEEKKLSFDLDLDEIKISNNKELTYQIVLNLLSNAVKYSNLKEEVKITLKDQKESFVFTITNKGQEIPKEDIDKVFNLFYTANKKKNQESTGIGLTLTKKIVDKLKGNISFDSNNGLTTFIVELAK